MTNQTNFTTANAHPLRTWQEAIKSWKKECIEALWPTLSKRIDWSQPLQSLKWEIANSAQAGEAVTEANLIYKVPSSDHSDHSDPLFWIHIVSEPKEPNTFAQGLFQLFCQLHTHYRKPILPLVIALNVTDAWQLQPYQAKVFGCLTHQFEFQTALFHKYLGSEAQLLSSKNAFEVLMGLYLKLQQQSTDPEARCSLKLELHQHLINHCKTNEEFIKLYGFLDQWLPLEAEFDRHYHESVYRWERKKNIDHLLNSEEFGVDRWIKKGHAQGTEEAKRRHLKRMLSIGVERKLMQEILGIDNKELNRLLVLEHDETMDTVIKTDL